MKRTKVILSLTTCILGIAAVAATKARYFGPIERGFYTNDQGKCTLWQLACSRGSTNICYTLGGSKTLFTAANPNGVCANVLKYDINGQ